MDHRTSKQAGTQVNLETVLSHGLAGAGVPMVKDSPNASYKLLEGVDLWPLP